MGTVRSIDMAGTRQGRLTVVSKTATPPGVSSRDQYWLCRCDCGATATISAKSLRHGIQTKSCGCLQRERAAESAAVTSASHGHARHRKPTREYRAWLHMRARCQNPNHDAFPYYGGRGVSVCERWRNSFELFLADVGPCPGPGYSIDRFPSAEGNYEPGNVRWATRSQQSRNRRDRKPVTFRGRTLLLCEWATELGIGIATLHSRLTRGWSIEKALSIDPKTYHKKS